MLVIPIHTMKRQSTNDTPRQKQNEMRHADFHLLMGLPYLLGTNCHKASKKQQNKLPLKGHLESCQIEEALTACYINQISSAPFTLF